MKCKHQISSIYCWFIYNEGLSHEKRMKQYKQKLLFRLRTNIDIWVAILASEITSCHVGTLQMNGLWHLLHSMELFLVNLAGKFCMQIMQTSTSSSDDDCDFFYWSGQLVWSVFVLRLSLFGGDCYRFIMLFSFMFCTSSHFDCFLLR